MSERAATTGWSSTHPEFVQKAYAKVATRSFEDRYKKKSSLPTSGGPLRKRPRVVVREPMQWTPRSFQCGPRLEILGDSLEEIVFVEGTRLAQAGELEALIREVEAVLDRGRWAEVRVIFDRLSAVDVCEPGRERDFLERVRFILVQARDGDHEDFEALAGEAGWTAKDLRMVV